MSLLYEPLPTRLRHLSHCCQSRIGGVFRPQISSTIEGKLSSARSETVWSKCSTRTRARWRSAWVRWQTSASGSWKTSSRRISTKWRVWNRRWNSRHSSWPRRRVGQPWCVSERGQKCSISCQLLRSFKKRCLAAFPNTDHSATETSLAQGSRLQFFPWFLFSALSSRELHWFYSWRENLSLRAKCKQYRCHLKWIRTWFCLSG